MSLIDLFVTRYIRWRCPMVDFWYSQTCTCVINMYGNYQQLISFLDITSPWTWLYLKKNQLLEKTTSKIQLQTIITMYVCQMKQWKQGYTDWIKDQRNNYFESCCKSCLFYTSKITLLLTKKWVFGYTTLSFASI